MFLDQQLGELRKQAPAMNSSLLTSLRYLSFKNILHCWKSQSRMGGSASSQFTEGGDLANRSNTQANYGLVNFAKKRFNQPQNLNLRHDCPGSSLLPQI